MKTILLLFGLLISSTVFSQDTLYLDSCLSIGIRNHPTNKDKESLQKINNLNLKNNTAGYFPTIDFEGKATYQSDAFRLELDLPDIPGFEINLPEPPLDQYNITLNISQLIYDGGTIKNLNQNEKIKLKSDLKINDIDLYSLREQIEKNYFVLLMFQQTEKQLVLTYEELNRKKNMVRSAVNNGLMSQDNLDLLQAEILKLEQGLIEINQNKIASINILSELLSSELSKNVIVSLPENVEINFDTLDIQRPEIELFSIQKELLNSGKNLFNAGRLPKLGAFAQAGYGNPGLTMVNDEWNTYFIIGAKFSWRIWDKNITNHNKQILEVKSDMISTKEEIFKKNIRILCEKERAQIEKLKDIIEKDKEIIKLRENICKKAEAKFDNGTMTSTDYLSLINEKNKAKILYEIHKIELIQAKRNYLSITGINN